MSIKMTITNVDKVEAFHTLDTIEQARKFIETEIGLDGAYGKIEGIRTCEPDLGAKVVRDWISRADGNAFAILTNCRLAHLLTEKERAGLAYAKGPPLIYPTRQLAIRVRREVFSAVNDASLGIRSTVLEQFLTFTEAEERYDVLLPQYDGPDETIHLSSWSKGEWLDYDRGPSDVVDCSASNSRSIG